MSPFFPSGAELGRHTIFPGVDIQTTACERMMLSVVEMKPGSVVESHSHPHEQVGMVLGGKALFIVGDEQKTLVTGDLYRIPGGVVHRVIASEEGLRALDIFTPVRDEYL
ncbi:MAG: cupin domain-containing protein [Planctomycetia bacterium]|nr:cupin domain-containing protein [Planctomycetia bacterium]